MVAQPRAAETGTPYLGARTCNPVLMPGVRKLRDLALVTYESGYDGSTARACAVGSTSEHQEGRAWDWMLDVDNCVDRRVAGHVRSGSPSPDETASGPAGTAARGDVRDLRPAHLVDLLRRRGVACRHRRLSAHRPRPPVVRLGGGLRRHVVLDRAGGGHRLRLVCGVRRPARIADRAGEPRAMFRSGGTGPAYRPPARPAGLQLVAGPGGAPAARVEGGREPRGTAPSTGPTRCCDAVRPGRRWPTCRSRCACRSPTAMDSSAPRPRPPYAPSVHAWPARECAGDRRGVVGSQCLTSITRRRGWLSVKTLNGALRSIASPKDTTPSKSPVKATPRSDASSSCRRLGPV